MCRPSVLIDQGLFHMWYCFRGENYRIGYAWSKNGRNWVRDDAQLQWLGESASDERCYPHIFVDQGRYYMLYGQKDYGTKGLHGR